MDWNTVEAVNEIENLAGKIIDQIFFIVGDRLEEADRETVINPQLLLLAGEGTEFRNSLNVLITDLIEDSISPKAWESLLGLSD